MNILCSKAIKFDIQKKQSLGFFYIKLPILSKLRYYLVEKIPFSVYTSLVFILYFLFTSSLDPEADPLCVILMIDYHAIRSYEYQYLLDLSNQWEVTHNS